MTEPPRELSLLYLTVNRSDFGRMAPTLERLNESPDAGLQLVVAGNHLDARYGHTADEVLASRLPVAARIADDAPYDPAAATAAIAARLPAVLAATRADYLLLLGDRYEVLAGALASLHDNVPILHLGGGYVTEGAIDDRVRHAITKLAAYHLVANEDCAQRVREMGEPPARIRVVGAPDIEAVHRVPEQSRYQLLGAVGLDPDRPFLLVTIHPETDSTDAADFDAPFAVLQDRPEQLLITAPAAERGSDRIFVNIEALRRNRADCAYVPHLGEGRYVNAMRHARAMFGNSSSGIIESTAVRVPSVSIGDRQKGRRLGENVISATLDPEEMAGALTLACSEDFRSHAATADSPFGDGRTSQHVAKFIRWLRTQPKPGPKGFWGGPRCTGVCFADD